MKKIVFINMYQNSALRGAETFVSNVSAYLKKDKFDVRIIGGDEKPGNRWPLLWRLFLDPNGFKVASFTIKSFGQLHRIKPDVIIPVNGGPMPLFVKIYTLVFGGKIILSGQSGMGWDERINLWSFPDVFVALSESALKWARRVNPLVRSVYIPNGVNTRNFSPVGRKVSTKLSPPIILCAGALTKEKRIDLTVRAVSKLEGVGLMIAGNPGDASQDIKNLCEKLLPGRCEILSFPHEKMPLVYRRADAFTLVSKPYFSFEISVVEALSTNLPVVINDDPIRRSIAGDEGIYIDPENTDQYASALSKALLKRNRNGRAVAMNFDWKSVSKKYSELIHGLV